MEAIREFIESNPLSFMIAVLVVLVVILLVVKWNRTPRKDYLNDDMEPKDDDDPGESEDDEEEPIGRFFVIGSFYLLDEWGDTFDVIVDRETKVQYLKYGDYGITPLIDADGKPILYKDDEEDQEESE